MSKSRYNPLDAGKTFNESPRVTFPKFITDEDRIAAQQKSDAVQDAARKKLGQAVEPDADDEYEPDES